MYSLPRPPLSVLLALAFVVLATPMRASMVQQPYEQDFVITAYYSPLPDQCCYIRGGERADKILNGEGAYGADGTPVYPGMLAAPGSYGFGTRVVLPGIGTLTVHDRGGAIQEQGDTHRLDIWVGYGEEGLARALAFGVQRVRGNVFPAGNEQPAESIDLKDLPAPLSRLDEFRLSSKTLLSVHPKVGEYGYSVRWLQEVLRDVRYFTGPITAVFDEKTETSLRQFITDYAVGEPSDTLTETTAAFLLAAKQRVAASQPVRGDINADSPTAIVREAQRTLRFLGEYRGRTDGVYDDDLAASILQFQQKNHLVGTAQDPGAGRIGPVTMRTLRARWDRTLVAARAQRYLLLHAVEQRLIARGTVLETFLTEGSLGDQVTLLQRLLAKRGFFPEDQINGSFGPLTRTGVVAFQLDRGIIASEKDPSAGNIGPATLAQFQREERRELYNLVRAEGMGAL